MRINKNTDGILEAEVLISEPLEVLSIMVDVEQVEMLMGYLFLQDESGKTRFQKLLGTVRESFRLGHLRNVRPSEVFREKLVREVGN